MGLADSCYFLPVTRAFLQPKPARNLPELFARLRVPKSPAYRIARFYERHGALRTAGGLRIDPRRVMNLQGGLRADRAVPDREAANGPPLEEGVRLLEARGMRLAVGFQTAANLHAYFEPAGAHALYVQDPRKGSGSVGLTAEALDALRAHPAASKADPYEFYVDDLARLDVHRVRGLPVTSPVQTVLDLAVHGRTAAHKEFLFENLRKQGEIDG